MMRFILLITAYIHPDDFVLQDEEDYDSGFGHSEENCGPIKKSFRQEKR